MYVATVPNRNSPPAILLRESFRQHGKVKNRTLLNISSWAPERIAALRRLLRGEFDHLADPLPSSGPVFALLYVLQQIAQQLGIPQALGRRRSGKLMLFLVLARLAHQGSRLSALRWARDHAVAEVLGLDGFDEDDLYGALEELCRRQEAIEQALYRRYLEHRGAPPALLLYDVSSSYLEGQRNEWGAYGYNRDGKRGQLQIVWGLLTDDAGEPLAVRVFAGNRGDPSTLGEQIRIVKEQFGADELVFVGDRGRVKSKGKQALQAAPWRYISALTDPQIRRLLKEGPWPLGLFEEKVCELEADGVRYLLRKNEDQAARQRQRLDDKLRQLTQQVEKRNQQVALSPRCQPPAGLRRLDAWVRQHKLQGLLKLRLQGRLLVLHKDEAALELAGCYVVVTDVPRQALAAQQAHDAYLGLQQVERDFRTFKTGLLQVRPLFGRKQSRTRGDVVCCLLGLKLARELERRLQAAFGAPLTSRRPSRCPPRWRR